MGVSHQEMWSWQRPVCPSLHLVQGIESNLQRREPSHRRNRGREFQQLSYPKISVLRHSCRLWMNSIRILFVANSQSKPSWRQLAKSEHPLKQPGVETLFLPWFFKCSSLQLSSVSHGLSKGQRNGIPSTTRSWFGFFHGLFTQLYKRVVCKGSDEWELLTQPR